VGEVNRGQRENALQEIVRMLGIFESEVCEAGTNEVVQLHLSPDGSGEVMFGSIHVKSTMYRFTTLAELKAFLAAKCPERMRLLATQAYRSRFDLAVE
jgi:hypothetical protein